MQLTAGMCSHTSRLFVQVYVYTHATISHVWCDGGVNFSTALHCYIDVGEAHCVCMCVCVCVCVCVYVCPSVSRS